MSNAFNINIRRFIPATLASALLFGLAGLPLRATQAAVVFNFNFTDAAGIGFNANGQTGADRRAALAQGADTIGMYLGAYNAVIDIDVNGSVTNDTTLASASSNFNLSYPGDGFGTRGDVMSKILGFGDPSAGADGQVNWNFEDFDWATGNTFLPGQQDLISTAAHEFMHTLGFASFIAQNGNSPWGDAPGTASSWSPFAQFVADSSGSLISNSFIMDGARWDVAKVGGSNNGLFFNGANASAANGGNAVPLYSPFSFQPGSSGGSHLDTDFFTGADAKMMNHSGVSEGLDIRSLSGIEIGILRDIGYTNARAVLVPEAGTLALILPALGMIGTVVVRRRNKKA